MGHALSCSRGGFVIMRHNEIRALTAAFLQEVVPYVEMEPNQQPITGKYLIGDQQMSKRIADWT